MKNQVLFLVLLTLSIAFVNAQPFNQEITPEGEEPILLGKINRDALLNESYSWFETNFEAYKPNKEISEKIKKTLPEYTITAFFGSWCGDSKKELPRFYKVLEETQFPLERLTVVGVSKERETYKQSPGGEDEGLNIHRVPTFIFYKDGKEVNRIVESPITSLEADILKILQKEEYVPNYNAVAIVNDALLDMSSEKFQKRGKKLLPKLKKVVKKYSELNTYSSVLFYSERKEEAIAVAKLNILLFPEESPAYQSLANKLVRLNLTEEAILNYKKALSLDPENEIAKKALAKIKTESLSKVIL
jgi:thiol-disulfide isomerase/thioredoxin